MSNLEASPAEQVCAAETGGPRDPVEILTPREVPLGSSPFRWCNSSCVGWWVV